MVIPRVDRLERTLRGRYLWNVVSRYETLVGRNPWPVLRGEEVML